MDLRIYCGDVVRSIGFLGRYPVPARFFGSEPVPLATLAASFPLAGLLVTAPAAALLWILLSAGVDPMLTAAIALTVQILSTGALHEDGLADAADGLFGGRDRERALEIMKDSRVGTYGMLATMLSLLLRVLALSGLFHATLSPLTVTAALLATAALSRALMAWHWQALPAARAGGIAAGAGSPSREHVRLGLVIGSAIALVLLVPILSLIPTVTVLAAAALAAWAFTRLVRAKIDGHTGDTIGATQQIAEIVMLACLAVFA